MDLDPAQIAPRDFYRHMIAAIAPRPIAWVSTISPAGVPNLAPFSFFNGITSEPPSLLFCPGLNADGRKKDTLINIEATQEFVVNVVPFALAEKMNATSAEFEYGVNEFEKAGVVSAPSNKVKPPRVMTSPVNFECVLHQVVSLGHGNVVIGKIVYLHVADAVLDPKGRIDPGKLDLIGRMGGLTYSRTTERFDIERPHLK